MGLFDEQGNITHSWNIFLKNFPGIGAFKLPHNSSEAYYDKNTAAILHIPPQGVTKEQFFSLLDILNEHPVDGQRNVFKRLHEGKIEYISIKVEYDVDCLLGFVQNVTHIIEDAINKSTPSELDPLTGINTRNHFIKCVRAELNRLGSNARCCMAAIHINGLERMDSELNYSKTNLCIATAANAIKRFAGDNIIIGVKSYKDFFVFFKQMSKKEVTETLKAMYKSVKNSRLTDEFGDIIQTRSDSFSLTSGYCWYPTQAQSIDMMINYADFALFSAISSGNIDMEFSEKAFVAENSRYDNSKLLSHLINGNDFDYCFQPIISVDTGNIYAYEALMRPKGCAPLEILDIARQQGKLYDIEMLTFENVLRIVKENQRQFDGKRIFINSIPDHIISERDFSRLCEKYEELISQLVVEFTEQSDLTGKRIALMRGLFCEQGCKVAIDDYGSGYSNTAAVLSLAPEIIKIDRSLIKKIDSDMKKQHFLTSIIEFAKLNNIKILAEGVETYEEMKVAILKGVDYIQGYYTARPDMEIITRISPTVKREIKELNEIKSGRNSLIR